MKTLLSVIGGMAVLMLLLVLPVQAEMSVVVDSDLSGISGKASNQYNFSGASSTAQAVSNDSSANIQVGWFQWNDVHSGDTTNHKGANDQSGTSTNVQENVVSSANVINWGAAAHNNLVITGGIGDGGANMAYGVFANGGF